MLHVVVEQVTAALEQRSAVHRGRYLARVQQAAEHEPRQRLGCSNLAHALAAQPDDARLIMKQGGSPHVAIISSYNDLLSAHAPLRDYPERLKVALAKAGATSQFAAGVPAMCDGITQGEGGMQLSLFSRDLIAQATAIGLTGGSVDQAVDLFVSPSRIEPFGRVIVEALDAGTPVIATDVGGVTEIIVDQETGLLHRLADRAGHRHGRRPRKTAACAGMKKTAFWCALVTVIALSLMPGAMLPPVFNFWDKAQHALAFVVLSGWALLLWPLHALRVVLVMLALLIGTPLGFCLGLSKTFTSQSHLSDRSLNFFV